MLTARARHRGTGVAAATGTTLMLLAAAGAPGAQAAATARTAAPARAAAAGTAAVSARAERAQAVSLPASATAQLVKDTQNAWSITRGGGVTVAVLSTGVAAGVTGLAGKVTTGPSYVKLPLGTPVDGTVIASSIAGSGPTGTSPIGTIGRAPGARILSLRIVPEPSVPGDTNFYESAPLGNITAEAIDYAVGAGAKVIFDEADGGLNSVQLEQAVQNAVTHDVVIVSLESSTGPDKNAPEYPDNLPGVLAAANVDLPGLPAPASRIASPSNESILVSAPGNEALATGPGNNIYEIQDQAPAVAWLTGTVALIKAVYPNLAPALVDRAIALSARDHPAGGYNTTVGFGLINPAGALQEAGTLARLKATAAAGPGVASPGTRLAAGPAPGVINAVHHDPAKLAGYGAAIVIGLACLVLAALLAVRGRRQRTPQDGAGPGETGLESAR